MYARFSWSELFKGKEEGGAKLEEEVEVEEEEWS